MKRLTLALFLLAFAAGARAEVTAHDPWARATVPGQKVAGAYVKLSADQATRLVSAASPAAQTVEIHQMSMENGVMKMRAVPALDIPAGGSVELKPGGYHLMLFGLKKPLAAGETITLTLKFQDAAGKSQTLELAANVRAAGESHAESHGGDHGEHGKH
jgi:copper(I)-binding protein